MSINPILPLHAELATLRQALTTQPNDGLIWQKLGFVAFQLQQYALAVDAFAQALKQGASARVQARLYALALSELGRHQEAIVILEPLQAKNQKDFEFANLLGVLYKRAGLLDAALRLFSHASKLQPRSISPWQNSGNTHWLKGNYPAAVNAFKRALNLAPKEAELWRLHGCALDLSGQPEAALVSLNKAMSLAPDTANIANALLGLLLKLKQREAALQVAQQFCAARPNDAEGSVMLARVQFRSGQIAAALATLQTIIETQPQHLSANLLLGAIHYDGNRRAANAAYQRAAAGNPDSWVAAERLIDSLSRSRFDSEAQHLEDGYRAACAFQEKFPHKRLEGARSLRTIFARMLDLPRFAATGDLSELLPHWQAEGRHYSVHYELGQVSSMAERVQLVEWHREWGRRVSAQIQPLPRPTMPALALGRKLRIGFMSSDLRHHPVSYFALPLLEQYDRERVEVFCYSFYEGERSPMQAHIESQVTAFRWWPKRPDDEVAAGIAADKLDILFELGGSSAMNKIEVMAYRPARINASWLGYPHSVGLETIDYIVVDPYIRPQDPRLLIEQAFELPETWVTMSAQGFAPVAITDTLPAIRRGHLTFGTANNPYKFTAAAIDAWAAVLRHVPNSHFLFLRPEAATTSFCENARAAFAARDVDPARLDFIGVRGTHLPHYNEIDIALDSLPHVGGTTTCEALWMGVPTISLVGDGFPERLSYSNLSNAGLGEFAVFKLDDYVAQAAQLAQDTARRQQLRQGLRAQIRAHPLGQVERFVQHFYQKAWEIAAL